MTDVNIQCGSGFIDVWVLDKHDLKVVVEADQTVVAVIVEGLFDGLGKVGVGALFVADIAIGEDLGSCSH